MPFLATCPFCPAKMKLSRKKLGASVQCEQCGNHFTAVPPDDFASGPSTFRQLAANASGSAPAMAITPAEGGESTPCPTTTEGACGSATPDTAFALPTPAIPGWINLWGFAGFFMTSVALVLATSGLLRWLSIPLAIVGLLLGLAGIALTPRKKPKDIVWLGLTATMAITFLLVAFVWPYHLNRFWGMDQNVPAVDPSTQFLASRNNQVPRGRELDGQAWVEADKDAVRQGDVHVRVEDVKVELDSSKDTPIPKNSLITLRFSNLGQLHRYTYRSPTLSGRPPTLRDNRGKAYALRNASSAAPLARALKPLASLYDRWSCEPVDAGIDYLELEVPASAWAGKGSCKFRIPRSMIAFPAKE